MILLLGNPKLKDFDVKDAKAVLLRPWARGIGDSIVSTGAIRELKKKYPHIKIYVIQRNRSRCVYAGNPHIEKVLPATLYHYLKLRNKVDVYVDCKHSVNISNLFACRLLNPKKIIGAPRTHRWGLKDADFSYYKNFPQDNKFDGCSHDKVLSCFPGFDLAPKKRKYDLYPSQKDIKTAESYWKKDKKRVILNIYGSNRVLDKQKIISVMNHIQKDFPDLDIVIPFDAKTKKGVSALCSPGGILNARLSYKTTLRQLFALVQSSGAVISVDTGIVHVASAFDKNTVCFIEEKMLEWWTPISTSYSSVICNVAETKNGKKQYSFDAAAAEEAIRKQLGGL